MPEILDANLVNNVKAKLNSLSSDVERNNAIEQFLNRRDLPKNIKDSAEAELKKLESSRNDREFFRFLDNLEEIIFKYNSSKDAITETTKALLPSPLLKDSDSFEYKGKHTSTKLKEADSMGFQELLNKINAIQLKWGVKQKDFDDYFDDCRKTLFVIPNFTDAEKQEFEKAVIEFKQTWIYNNWFDLEQVNNNLNEDIESIKNLPNWTPFTVDFNEKQITFTDKEQALRYIYKIKLLLEQLDADLASGLSTSGLSSWSWKTILKDPIMSYILSN